MTSSGARARASAPSSPSSTRATSSPSCGSSPARRPRSWPPSKRRCARRRRISNSSAPRDCGTGWARSARRPSPSRWLPTHRGLRRAGHRRRRARSRRAVFYVRRGRVVGRSGFVADKVEDLTHPSSSADPRRALRRPGCGGAPAHPRARASRRGGDLQRLARDPPARSGAPGGPRRGAKRSLQQMVTANARRTSRATGCGARRTTTPARAPSPSSRRPSTCPSPTAHRVLRLSHLQGTDYVGSMVVFEDGLAKKSDYRRFKVKTVAGNDDYAAMEEVLTRRLSALRGRAGRA